MSNTLASDDDKEQNRSQILERTFEDLILKVKLLELNREFSNSDFTSFVSFFCLIVNLGRNSV